MRSRCVHIAMLRMVWIIRSESHIISVSGITKLEKHNIPCLDLFRLHAFDCYTQDELIQGSSHGSSPSVDDPSHEPIKCVMCVRALSGFFVNPRL